MSPIPGPAPTPDVTVLTVRETWLFRALGAIVGAGIVALTVWIGWSR